MTRRLAWFMVWGTLVIGWAGAQAQFVSGDWVQRGEASIQKYRTTPVSFLVLDAQGKLAPGAQVHVEQLNHGFTLGFAAHDRFPEAYDAAAEGWRVFNAVSLENMTAWRQIQPTGPEEFASEAVEAVLDRAKQAGLKIRWGAFVSAESFALPEWVVPLRGEAISDAARQYIKQIGLRLGPRLDSFDVASGTLDDGRLSPATLRLLAMDAAAAWPDVTPSLNFGEAFTGSRSFDLVVAIDDVVKQRLAIERFTVSENFPPSPVAQDMLEPAVKRLANLGQPLTVGSLEIGGTHAIETAVNTETVVRTLFAEPMVEGIYFAGLFAPDMLDPSSALFEPGGEATAVARTLDRLFLEVWWSDLQLTADALGRAEARVYLGDYRVTATLPDGDRVEVTLHLGMRNESPDEIVLMPVDGGESTTP